MKALTVTEREALNHYETDEGNSHIHVNQEVARRTGALAILRAVCPARVYGENPDGTISVEFAACFECGACLEVAPPGALEWHYPASGMGIQYREG
ncbi:MAG: ferredoxin [Actinomyces sp.]|nr:ferredoxin [Actinomyces sp.]